MTPQQIPLAHARYATNRLQRLAGHPRYDLRTINGGPDAWRFDARELASSLRELASYCESQSRRACDDCPAQLRSVAAHVLAWHDSRGKRGEALREVFEMLHACEGGWSGADLVDGLTGWATRHGALCHAAELLPGAGD